MCVHSQVYLIVSRCIVLIINNFIAEAHIAGIHVVLLLVGDGLMTGNNYLELHAIASEPYPQNIYNVRRFNVLEGLIPDIASALCNGKWIVKCINT